MSRKKLFCTAPFRIIRMSPLFSTTKSLPEPSPQPVISTGLTSAGPLRVIAVILTVSGVGGGCVKATVVKRENKVSSVSLIVINYFKSIKGICSKVI
jgi:hypothetical protein